MPGEPVPDVPLVNQDGKTLHLSQFKGKAVLVTFEKMLETVSRAGVVVALPSELVKTASNCSPLCEEFATKE